MSDVLVGPGDFVKVAYHGINRRHYDSKANDRVARYERDDETPLRIMLNSREYIIPVGGEKHVPFELAAKEFGDPRTSEKMRSYKDESGSVGFILDRATEVRRLRALYDNQAGDEQVIDGAPEVTVTDLEGNQITTVLDDPLGQSVMPVQQTRQDVASLLAQLQRQQRMIELLAEQQGVDVSNPNLVLNSEPKTEDEDPEAINTEPLTIPEDK